MNAAVPPGRSQPKQVTGRSLSQARPKDRRTHCSGIVRHGLRIPLGAWLSGLLAWMGFVGMGAAAVQPAEVEVSLTRVPTQPYWRGEATLGTNLYSFAVPASAVRDARTESRLPRLSAPPGAALSVRLGARTEGPVAEGIYGNLSQGQFLSFTRLFLGGRLWTVQVLPAQPGTNSHPSLKLTETAAEYGTLRLSGSNVLELDLEGDQAVLLSAPGPTVRLPAGRYSRFKAFLGMAGKSVEAATESGAGLVVKPGEAVELACGGPLRNTVQATRQGRSLRMDYRLTDAAGRAVQWMKVQPTQPPEAVIYQRERRLATGRFEYG